MSVQVSYKKQTLLGIIGLLISFLVIEVIANVWWITQITCEFEDNEIFINMDEEEKRQLCIDLYEVKTLGTELIPNQKSDSITINSMGFRGDEFSIEKSENIFRIFMLGGSTMFGHGATSDHTTIPGYTQQLLAQYDDGFEIEVINAGIQGADSFTEVELIENKLLNYDPDMIIIYDGWNDLRAKNPSNTILENWNLICDLGQKNNFNVIIALQPIAGFGNKILTSQEYSYSKTGTNYNNSPLINSLNLYEHYALNLTKINSCTASVDLRSIFDNETSQIYWDQGHVSDEGNKIVANSLYEKIFELLPRKPSQTYDSSIIMDEKTNLIFESELKYLLSGYKTPVLLNSLLSFKEHEVFVAETMVELEDNNLIFETQSQFYNDDEFRIQVEIIEPNNIKKQLKIITYNETLESQVPNVTYFLKIFEGDKIIFNDFIYVENEILLLDVVQEDTNSIEVYGTRQYDHNALIAKNDPPILLKGPLFNNELYFYFFSLSNFCIIN